MPDELMQRVLAKRDRIAALPPAIRSQVINRLYDRVVVPKIPKAFGDDQKTALKTSFENSILGGRTEINLPPRESDRKAVGQETGMQGRFHAGFDAGLGNVAHILDKLDPEGILGPKAEPTLQEKAKLEKEASEAYAKRHPFKAGAAELIGQGLPAEPAMAAIPGGGLAANMARGAIGMVPYDPSGSGVALGAGGAGLLHGAFAGLGRLAKRMPTPRLPSRARTTNVPAQLAELASKTGKKFEDMSPDEKLKLVDEWKSRNAQASSDATKAKTAQKAQAVKDAETARVKAASAKVDEKVATRRAMDEAKLLQKGITAFVKTHKRAPNEQELIKLKQEVIELHKAGITDFSHAKAPQAESEIEAARRGASGEPPAVTPPPNEVPNAARASTQIIADQFKATNPEAIKAAQAVSEVAKQVAPPGQSGLSASEQKLMAKIDDSYARMAEAKDPKVTAALQKTIENAKLGLQGNKEAMQRIADAERKAAERAKAAPTEETSKSLETAKDTRLNPEEALAAKEEEFYKMTDKLEAYGPKGKEAAKNINMLVKAKRMTMDEAIVMLPQIEAKLK